MTQLSARQSFYNIERNSDFVNVGEFSNVKVNLLYASENNLLKEDVYGGYQKAFLHKVAAEKFLIACEQLRKEKKDWSFL